MSTLTLYIFRQILAPLLIIALTLSGLIWMLRALRLLDTFILSGQSAATWLTFLLYTAPTALILTIPPAFLIATLYAFYRLFMDNEITVMFSVGISRTRLIRPVMLLAGLTAVLVMLTGFYAVPWSNRILKDHALQIDADIASAILRPGIFTNPIGGVTAFIRERDENGAIRGIFFQDSRNPNKSVSYIAESGVLTQAENRSELIMFNGHIQHYDRTIKNGGITLIKFDRYSYDLSSLVKKRKAGQPKSDELYPDQILEQIARPGISAKKKEKLIKSIHENMLKPIYVIVYALLALAVFLPAQTNREGYMRRVTIAVLTALAMRISGIYMIDFLAGRSVEGAVLTYAVPAGVAILALFVIMRGVGPIARIRHRIATARS